MDSRPQVRPIDGVTVGGLLHHGINAGLIIINRELAGEVGAINLSIAGSGDD